MQNFQGTFQPEIVLQDQIYQGAVSKATNKKILHRHPPS